MLDDRLEECFSNQQQAFRRFPFSLSASGRAERDPQIHLMFFCAMLTLDEIYIPSFRDIGGELREINKNIPSKCALQFASFSN